ncbi:MAG: DUF2798 domain-containing protein [Litoreibacter sp.]|nr:DUF2798 domain-containing protein [Alphaproteobacteria bacterium]NNK79535.1 DUF2798 domain-containing protein [Litoreibacter sp.]
MFTRAMLAHIIFSALASGIMSALVCGLVTYKAAGLSSAFMHVWFGGWVFAWPVAFAVLVVVGPLLRKNVYRACNCPLNAPQPNSIPDRHQQQAEHQA